MPDEIDLFVGRGAEILAFDDISLPGYLSVFGNDEGEEFKDEGDD
jgi:hypothetical protein